MMIAEARTPISSVAPKKNCGRDGGAGQSTNFALAVNFVDPTVAVRFRAMLAALRSK